MVSGAQATQTRRLGVKAGFIIIGLVVLGIFAWGIVIPAYQQNQAAARAEMEINRQEYAAYF